MTTLTGSQVYALARNAGLNPAAATIATAISKAESGWRTDAMGDVGLQNSTWGPSIGLWQIRSVKAQSGTGQTRDATRLTDPAFNAASMVAISSGGTRWTPWSVYTSGAYRKFLGSGTEAETASGGIAGVLQGIGAGIGVGVGAVLGKPAGSAAGAAAGAVTDAAGTVVDGVSAVTGWASSAQEIGIKLLAVGTAAALVVIGVTKTVSK